MELSNLHYTTWKTAASVPELIADCLIVRHTYIPPMGDMMGNWRLNSRVRTMYEIPLGLY
jgi:hypothetical protein